MDVGIIHACKIKLSNLSNKNLTKNNIKKINIIKSIHNNIKTLIKIIIFLFDSFFSEFDCCISINLSEGK